MLIADQQEEAGISAPLTQIGTFIFVMEDSELAFHITLFRADQYTGEIKE
jgi:hypothetical protein